MKTIQDVIEDGENHRADQALREQTFLRRQRHFRRKFITFGAGISATSYGILMCAVHQQVFYLLLSFVPGLAAAKIIIVSGCGLLRGMLIYSLVQCLYLTGGLMLNGWSMVDAGMLQMGPLLILFSFIVSWPVVGGLLGHVSETFENDNLHI